MVRGSGKFKTKRGGGRNFSRDIGLDNNGVAVSKASRRKKEEEEEEEEEEDDDDEEGEGEEAAPGPSGIPAQPELTRIERRELKKKQAAQKQAANKGPDEDDEDADGADGVDSRDMILQVDYDGVAESTPSRRKEDDNDASGPSGAPAQPELTRAERRELKKQAANKGPDEGPNRNRNHVQKKLDMSIAGLGSREMTPQEREKKEARNRYWKLRVAGKTHEAKADLARLEKVREEREAAQAKRTAEAEAKAAEAEAKKKAAMSGKRV